MSNPRGSNGFQVSSVSFEKPILFPHSSRACYFPFANFQVEASHARYLNCSIKKTSKGQQGSYFTFPFCFASFSFELVENIQINRFFRNREKFPLFTIVILTHLIFRGPFIQRKKIKKNHFESCWLF